MVSVDQKQTRMPLTTFDKWSGIALAAALGFSLGVAAAEWEWFPTTGDTRYIAVIPQTCLNYIALLLPWIMLLGYLLCRRLWFNRPL